VNYVIAASHLAFDDVTDIVRAGPIEITAVWTRQRVREMPLLAYILAKALLRLLCRHRLRGWSDTYDAYITTTLPLPARDAYTGVRSGDVFLSADEEAAIVRYLDEMAESLSSSVETAHENVCDAGMLLCAYQFAMRPIQIAMLSVRNVRTWWDAPEALP
jgi:hypothetical protein